MTTFMKTSLLIASTTLVGIASAVFLEISPEIHYKCVDGKLYSKIADTNVYQKETQDFYDGVDCTI